MNKLLLQIISPEKTIASIDVTQAVLPGEEGRLGILHGHESYIITLQPGVVEIYQDEVLAENYIVSSGVAEIIGSSCTVLVDEAIKSDQIDMSLFNDRLEKLQSEMENDIYNTMKQEMGRIKFEEQRYG